jgi:carbon monoxide dehydrogenase subunit G
MARTSIDIAAAPEVVWSVLADAETYGEWVVGTRKIVSADDRWPEPGASLEYELGVGPLTVSDRTTVIESEPPHMLLLRAELRRFGSAAIRVALEGVDGQTRVVMDEEPVDGVVGAIHTRLTDAALKRRNDAALQRLRRLAESRAWPTPS